MWLNCVCDASTDKMLACAPANTVFLASSSLSLKEEGCGLAVILELGNDVSHGIASLNDDSGSSYTALHRSSCNKTSRCPFQLLLVSREAMAESASYAYRMQTVSLAECQCETVFESAESMFVGGHVEPHCNDKRDN